MRHFIQWVDGTNRLPEEVAVVEVGFPEDGIELELPNLQ
jgi:hypothetical protein